MNAPQLYFNVQDNRWQLNLQRQLCYDDESFCCQIRYAWDGESWSHFRFFQYDMGDKIELYTRAEYDQRLQDIEDHEGKEVADDWAMTQTSVRVVRDDHPVFTLRDHWNAMMTLNLFVPHVTL